MIVNKLIEENTELITRQAEKFQELIKIKYEIYFLNETKDTRPFMELHKYLLSIQETINTPHISHSFNSFNPKFSAHIEEKDKQYYKKYLKYKSKYINIKKNNY